MTGDALSNECFIGKCSDCQNNIVGYQKMHVECTCACHNPDLY